MSGKAVLHPIVVVISGPSGVGKDAVIAKMKERGKGLHYVVTATTRPRRSKETEGKDYHFLSIQQFNNKIREDAFLEYARVYGHYYGVLKSEVRAALKKGQDVIIKVDIQGAATLKKKIPDGLYIFLLPESLSDLESRLRLRNADADPDMQIRLKTAQEEIARQAMFDYTVVNQRNQLALTAETVERIIESEKRKAKVRKVLI